MSKTFRSGGCQCGAVRYRVSQKPTGSHLCHCRMCQKQFGNFYAALASVPRASFNVTRGEIANFRSSRDVQRGFCRDCGTPLTYDPMTKDIIAIAIATLDSYADLKPEKQCGIESRLDWVDRLSDLTAESSAFDVAFAKLLPDIQRTNRQHPDHDTDVWPLPDSPE